MTRPPRGYVSSATAWEARTDLLWVADRWPDLNARLRPGGGTGDGIRTQYGSREPYNVHISDLMFAIEEHARFLGQVLIEETDDWTPTTSTMPTLLREVAERYGHFTAGDGKTALDFCDDAHDLREKVTHALERPPAPEYIGDCPNGDCEGDLYVRSGRRTMVCRECHQETDVETQQEFIKGKLEARLMTQSELASAMVLLGHEVKFATIRKWVERDRLVPVVDGLYRLVDAMALAEKRREKVTA